MPPLRCEDCEFFEEDPGNGGFCHRFPPVYRHFDPGTGERISAVARLARVSGAELPAVPPNGWCGEHTGYVPGQGEQ